MSLDFILKIISAAAETNLSELEVIENGMRIKLVRGGTPDAVVAPPPSLDALATPELGSKATDNAASDVIRATTPGIVHLTPSPSEPSFVSAGAVVNAGATLCLVEAMKLFMPLNAEASVRIVEILVLTGTEVTVGQPLFRVEGMDR